MIAIETGCAVPVPCRLKSTGGLAYNGSGFALLNRQSHEILKLDGCMQHTGTFCCAKDYSSICYDPHERCYWAAAGGKAEVLYRLDDDFCETGTLYTGGSRGQRLHALDCDCCGDGFVLAFSGSVGYAAKPDGNTEYTQCPGRNRVNLDVVSICGGCIVCFIRDGKQIIEVECPCCGPRVEFCVPREYFLEGMALCKMHCDEREGRTKYTLLLLLTHNCCETVVMECVVSCCEESIHHCPPPCPPCPCPPPCPPCPCPPPYPPVCDCCAPFEIMHSIALEEAGIAHILNAEGEKLQKAVATSTNIDDLLAVNESVKRTITQIMLLEGQLYAKLETLTSNCGCDCEPCPRPMPGSETPIS